MSPSAVSPQCDSDGHRCHSRQTFTRRYGRGLPKNSRMDGFRRAGYRSGVPDGYVLQTHKFVGRICDALRICCRFSHILLRIPELSFCQPDLGYLLGLPLDRSCCLCGHNRAARGPTCYSRGYQLQDIGKLQRLGHCHRTYLGRALRSILVNCAQCGAKKS